MISLHSQIHRRLRKIACETVGVLIVEDNDASRRLVQELMRAAGFTKLSFARNAEEAIVQIGHHHPDLILLDWGLPGMSGIDLVREIRKAALQPDARFPNPEVPIVMLTARQRHRDVTTARNAGINDFVVKPFSTTTLLKAVSGALTKKRRFITTPEFTGPDRRRRKAALFPGLLRREGEHGPGGLRETLTAEMTRLRETLKTRHRPDQATLGDMIGRLLKVQTDAHGMRLQLIEQATHSLNDYVQYFGEKAEAEVLDVHLDALIRLNDAPYADHEEAVNIVSHLNRLVTQRRSRKAS
ncbi:MAG: response regulator [Asticcacaulis sp.]|nr:response regulator [Asticcacaulis sp.]